MTKQTQDIFFAIIQAAIWTDDDGHPTDDRMSEVTQFVPNGYDWTDLIRALEEHSMLGVVADAIMRMPSAKRPTQAQQNSILSHVAQLVRQRYKMRQTIVKVFKTLEGSDCHPILLKGEGLATLYPKTCHRSIGDVDLYLCPDEFDRGVEICRTMATIDSQHPNEFVDCHQLLSIDGVDFEIHNQPGYCATGTCEEAYQQYSRPWLDWRIADTVLINGMDIRVFNHTYNLFYVFNHLGDHYCTDGLGVRQFIDVIYLLRQKKNINTKELQNALTTTDNLRAWIIFSAFMHLYLDVPADMIPLYDNKQESKVTTRLVSYITDNGNFGFYNAHNVDILDKNIFRRRMRMFWRFITYVRPACKLVYPQETKRQLKSMISRFGIYYIKSKI